MALLPSSRTNFNVSAASILNEIKKGGDERRNEFIYTHQERVYATALMATGDSDNAQELTIQAFKNAFASLKQNMPKKDSDLTIWEWLSQFIVEACGEYHLQNSDPPADNPSIDPAADGSASMDWETTILLGPQRIKRCLGSLPEEQQKAFYLRHHLDLNYEQISAVLNQSVDMTMAALFRARVQVVKCLGRG